MKTIELKLYKFEELTEEMQEKAMEKYWDFNVDYDWWDCTYMDAENVGLKISGFDIDRGSYCNIDFIEDAEYTANEIIEEHGPDCETYRDSENFLKEFEVLNDKFNDEFLDDYEVDDEIENLKDEYLHSLSENYRIMLQKEYEYLTSEDAIRESLIINDYDFTENGEIY